MEFLRRLRGRSPPCSAELERRGLGVATPAFEGDCEIQQREYVGKMGAEGFHQYLEELGGILLLDPLSCERLPHEIR
jgi:hypothetical protein